MESVGEVPAHKDNAILGRNRAYLQQVAAVVDGPSVAVARAELECGRRVAGEISVADVRSVYSELAGIVAQRAKAELYLCRLHSSAQTASLRRLDSRRRATSTLNRSTPWVDRWPLFRSSSMLNR